MSLYLDANIVLASLVQELRTAAVLRFLAEAREPLAVSDFTAAEVASALSRLLRMQELSESAARAALADFDAWRLAQTEPVEIENVDIASAGLLVRQFELKLRTPDALHLAICLRTGASLVTHDSALVAAAAANGAPTIQP